MIINQYIKESHLKKRSQIKIDTLIANDSFLNLNTKIDKSEFNEVNITVYNENFSYYLAKINLKRDLYINFLDDDFIICQKENFIYIITSGNDLFINSGVLYLFKNLYAKIIMCFITSQDIFNLLEYFEAYYNLKIYHKKSYKKEIIWYKRYRYKL